MHSPWWKRLADRYRGTLWPIHYRTPDGSSWWSWRSRHFRVRLAHECEWVALYGDAINDARGARWRCRRCGTTHSNPVSRRPA